jgi:hypothetical protein
MISPAPSTPTGGQLSTNIHPFRRSPAPDRSCCSALTTIESPPVLAIPILARRSWKFPGNNVCAAGVQLERAVIEFRFFSDLHRGDHRNTTLSQPAAVSEVTNGIGKSQRALVILPRHLVVNGECAPVLCKHNTGQRGRSRLGRICPASTKRNADCEKYRASNLGIHGMVILPPKL